MSGIQFSFSFGNISNGDLNSLFNISGNNSSNFFPTDMFGESNPSFLQNIFGLFPGMTPFNNEADLMDLLYRQYQPRGPPPASKEFMDHLPEIIVGQMEIDCKTECSVCKDQFEFHEKALRLPCGHLYHRDCILPWLKDHNTCPTCRYELPTDNQDYEKERKKRMASRNVDETVTTSTEDISQDNQIEEEIQVQNQMNRCDYGNTVKEDCVLLDSDEIVPLTCGHNIHFECLESNLRISGALKIGETLDSQTFSCPICRQDVSVIRSLDVD